MGTLLRPVRVEYEAVSYVSVVVGGVFLVASAFVHRVEITGIAATLVGWCIGTAVAMQFDTASRFARPAAWSEGAAPEPAKRVYLRTFVLVSAAWIIVGGVLVAAENDARVLPFYAALELFSSVTWLIRARRFVKFEHALGVTVYREVNRFPHWFRRTQHFTHG